VLGCDLQSFLLKVYDPPALSLLIQRYAPTHFPEDDARLGLVRKLEMERKQHDASSPDWLRFKNQMPLKMYSYAAG